MTAGVAMFMAHPEPRTTGHLICTTYAAMHSAYSTLMLVDNVQILFFFVFCVSLWYVIFKTQCF